MRHALLVVALLAGCGDNLADPSLALLGGDTTIFDDGDEAFNYPLRNLRQELRGPFQIGDGVFNRNWVTAPATPTRQRRARSHLQRAVVLGLSRR